MYDCTHVKDRYCYLLLPNRKPGHTPCWKPKGSTMKPGTEIQQGALISREAARTS